MTQRYEFEWFSWVFRLIKESAYSLEYVHMNLPLNKKKKKDSFKFQNYSSLAREEILKFKGQVVYLMPLRINV